MKIFLTVFTLQSGHNFHRKKSKEHNSVKMYLQLRFFLCISSDGSLYLYKDS